MGMWDIRPWDNDEAADWYAGFMCNTNFRQHWLEGISKDTDDSVDEIRAAAALFIMLGKVYIWPIEHYDQDLELTIKQLSKTLDSPENAECDELMAVIKAEITELTNRQKPGYQSENPRSTWW